MSEPLQAIRAEAEAPDDGITVALETDDGEVEFFIERPPRWHLGAVEAINAMPPRYNEWAELALDEENHAKWVSVQRSTRYGALGPFFTELWARVGEDPKPSGPSKGSSRSTRKR